MRCSTRLSLIQSIVDASCCTATISRRPETRRWTSAISVSASARM
jgi:hypothetical protein